MPTTWPSSVLPSSFLEEGYYEEWAENRIVSPTDVGPPKVRRRGTAAPWFFGGQMIMSSTQVGSLRTFYDTTLASNTTPFTIVQPRSGSTVTCLFKNPPTIHPSGAGSNSTGGWKVKIDFMVLP